MLRLAILKNSIYSTYKTQKYMFIEYINSYLTIVLINYLYRYIDLYL